MRKVREVLRLYYAAGMSARAIARSLKVSPAVPAKAGMGKCIRRAEARGVSWPLPDSVDDAWLERRLFPAPVPNARRRAMLRWSEVHRELRRKGVTLALLWEEYKAAHPEGLQSSWFCEQCRAWASRLDVVMRQEHRAGEKLFVDYAGHTVGVVDRHTGELLSERRSSSRCSGRRATSPRTRGPRGRRAWRSGLRRTCARFERDPVREGRRAPSALDSGAAPVREDEKTFMSWPPSGNPTVSILPFR